jgi:choline dehydrogenase
MPPPEHYDVIVVGAGAAGSPAAARLSEDPGTRVLLLEAGAVPTTLGGFAPELLDAGTLRGAAPGHPANWAYPAHLTADRPYAIARGRVLGGSTAINGGYFERARRADFDRWSAGGNEEWSAERVLPVLRSMESDTDFGHEPGHGSTGPIPITRPALHAPAERAFGEACAELGFAAEPDKNGEQPPGFGPVPLATVDGVRWNTGLAYVLPALGRRNLTVRGGNVVHRVVFDGSRAIGVDVESGGAVSRILGSHIVLAAGSIGTPHLLLLSGVGPPAGLEAAGVRVVHGAPGVGESFSDHPSVTVEWIPRGEHAGSRDRVLGGALNLTSPGSPVPGDLEILQVMTPTARLLTADQSATGNPSFIVALQSASSRGSIELRSGDPVAPPTIDYNYLATTDDRSRFRCGVRMLAAVLATRAFSAVADRLVDLDDATLGDDRALDAWVRHRLGTSIHLCGSARFGPPGDPLAVTDQYGRVLGVEGLRVADTSLLPDAPTRGPAATAVLIGELAAGFIRRGL